MNAVEDMQEAFDPDTRLVKCKYSFFPLDAPGMPPPGPSFIEAAASLGDEKIKFKTDVPFQCGKNLTQLYYDALYEDGFNLKMRVKGRVVDVGFLRGHLWGCKPGGPVPLESACTNGQPRVMVVGKWPGMEEMGRGRNFTGPSGELTMRTIEDCGIPNEWHDLWYVTNVIRHINLNPASNTASKDWLKNCRPLLEQELRIVRPDFILALGAEAAKEMIGEDIRIDSIHGRVFKRQIQFNLPGQPDQFHETQVMACLHPARILRSADKMPEFRATLQRFARLIKGETIDVVSKPPDHRLIYSELELATIVNQIIAEADDSSEPQIVAIDCEWHGDFPTEPDAWLRTIQFSHKPGVAFCVVLKHRGGDPAFIPCAPCDSAEEALARQLRRLLVDTPKRRVRLAGHNLRADLPWVYHAIDEELGKELIKQFTGPELPEDTRTAGGFDTMMAAHSVTESPGDMGFKLEVLALNICGIPRYDTALQRWKSSYCKEHDIAAKNLEGYGECPDEVILGTVLDKPVEGSPYLAGTPVKDSYSCWDADATRALVHEYNRPGGLLDHDQYGNSSRVPFWISMRAMQAFLEMEMTGMLIDRKGGDELTDCFKEAKERLKVELCELIRWPEFNPASHQQCATLLFGPELAGKFDKKTGETINVAPPGAACLHLEPLKTSGKPSKMWEQVERRRETHLYSPSTDKEVLGIMVTRLMASQDPNVVVVRTLRWVRFVSQVLNSMLREPTIDPITKEIEFDDEGLRNYEGGLFSFVHADNRVRTHIFPTKETGRCSTARPPLQNLSKRRESEYKQILGDKYIRPLRSVVMASPGHALVEADYIGAELFMMALQAGDEKMIDHCQRSNLDKKDPRYYDIHSNVAVQAFKLTVDSQEAADKLGLPVGHILPATKEGLEAIGRVKIRDVAKTIAFGIPYGRGDDAVIRAVEEEGVYLSREEAEAIRNAIFENYAKLPDYLDRCKARVTNPGWLRNCFGRYRRFQNIGMTDGGEMERQARNYPIQSGVADGVSRALDYLYNRSDRITTEGIYRYRLVLQVHDAVIFEVRIPDLEWFIDEVLPWAMTKQVPIWSCDFDGKRLAGPYTMGVESSVMLNWGLKIPYDKGQELGIPARFCEKPKK